MVTGGGATTEAEAGSAGAARRVVAAQVAKFALAGAVALVIVGLATAVASRRLGEREAVADARTTTVIKAQGVVEPALSRALLAGDPAAREAVDAVVRRDVLDASLVRVKLWTRDGTIVYSDEQRLVGGRYALGDHEQDALQTGRIVAEVSELAGPENRFERGHGRLLEVYLPIRGPDGERLLFEAYYRYEMVATNAGRLWRSIAPITLGALVMLQVVQIPLAWSLARRLRERLREREALMRRALQASDIERRKIASDLHDGAVQDLAGVAYALTAAGRRLEGTAPADAALVEDAATSVRGSIKALRSLIVDIYPPNFDEVSFESALAELLTRAKERGLVVDVESSGLNGALPDHVARVLYRVAQEGVRNVIAHAGASEVRVTVATTAQRATIEVVDDGRGLSEEEDAPARGHVGLIALRGLVEDAGGTLEVRSERDRGTVLRAEVPL